MSRKVFAVSALVLMAAAGGLAGCKPAPGGKGGKAAVTVPTSNYAAIANGKDIARAKITSWRVVGEELRHFMSSQPIPVANSTYAQASTGVAKKGTGTISVNQPSTKFLK